MDEELEKKIKKMEEEGLIGFERDYTGFYLCIAWVLMMVLLNVCIIKSRFM